MTPPTPARKFSPVTGVYFNFIVIINYILSDVNLLKFIKVCFITQHMFCSG